MGRTQASRFSLLFIVFCFKHFIICKKSWTIYGNLCFNIIIFAVLFLNVNDHKWSVNYRKYQVSLIVICFSGLRVLPIEGELEGVSFLFLGPWIKSSIAPASSMRMPAADSHCHGSLTISTMAYLSPWGDVEKLTRYIFSLIVRA